MADYVITTGVVSSTLEKDGRKSPFLRNGQIKPLAEDVNGDIVFLYDTTSIFTPFSLRLIIDLSADTIDIDGVTSFANAGELLTALEPVFYGDESSNVPQNRIIVNQNNYSSIFSSPLDSTKEYFIDGNINTLDVSIVVPTGGLLMTGYGFDISKLSSSEDNFNLFDTTSSGNLFLRGLSIEITGTSSQVFNLTGSTGFESVEMTEVNFDNCTSLGSLETFRQGLELNTGRFGGTPELEFIGSWAGGYRIDTSIALNMSDFTALFKEGTGFTFDGRFIININCNLPAIGALCDFQPSNVTNNDSFKIEGSFIRRQDVIDGMDTTILPNITERDVKSLWNDNVGVPNTQKFYRQTITTEVTTTITATNTYEILAGTWTGDADPSHFDSPANGQIRLLSGEGKFQVAGEISIEGTANDVLGLRVMKSTDDGATFNIEVNSISRQINSLPGARDVAFFSVIFLTSLQTNDRIRLEVQNTTSTGNVTAELDSTLIVTQV